MPRNDFRDADPHTLADTILSTVETWGERYARVLLELSGGLDSSIIACGLADRSAPLQCVTFHAPGADGDERSYAHIMARCADAPIVDIPVQPHDFDLQRQPGRLRPRPGGFGAIDAIDRASMDAAAAFGTDAIFSGTGGDNVFCFIASAAPVLDALRASGPTQALRTMADIARLTGETSWDVLIHVLRRTVRDVLRPQTWPQTTDFLQPDAAPPLAPHPWLDRPTGTLAGSRAHIASILRAMPLIDAFDRATHPGLVFPLLSQPIVEACLAIPSWQWMTGGRDRAAVRTAFQALLPEEIVGRRSKGRLESAIVPAFEHARVSLTDLLVDGELVRQGIVDPKAVREATRQPVHGNDGRYTRILELVDAELWVRSIRDGGGATATHR